MRVKILRRLKGLGAVALKNSVYLLPETEAAREDFHWLRREIVGGGGEASLSSARFLEGASDRELEDVFSAERDEEYKELTVSIRTAAHQLTQADVERLRRRLDTIRERDYFGATGRFAAVQALEEVARQARGGAGEEQRPLTERPKAATWVTRAGARIDRMASAWLIRRLIDPDARFKFVDPERYRAQKGELRFDMFEGEFTHEGDCCTFETLLARFGLNDPGLIPIAEIVHDIDCKDEKHGRPETPGVASVVSGIAAAHPRDEDRIAAAAALFDALFARFRPGQAAP